MTTKNSLFALLHTIESYQETPEHYCVLTMQDEEMKESEDRKTPVRTLNRKGKKTKK